MTINEAKEILKGAAWNREPHVAALLDDLVEKHDQPAKPDEPGRVTRQVASAKAAYGTGWLVALVLNLRRRWAKDIYELGGD